jgi:hypothetical protein
MGRFDMKKEKGGLFSSVKMVSFIYLGWWGVDTTTSTDPIFPSRT